MIIGMSLLGPVANLAEAADAPNFPSPTTFVNNMELGDLRQAEAWLDAGLPPDFMGSRIGSGLMIGAWEGNIELMRLFISRGADIDLANENGETAIALAAWRGHQDVSSGCWSAARALMRRTASGRRCIMRCLPVMPR